MNSMKWIIVATLTIAMGTLGIAWAGGDCCGAKDAPVPTDPCTCDPCECGEDCSCEDCLME